MEHVEKRIHNRAWHAEDELCKTLGVPYRTRTRRRCEAAQKALADHIPRWQIMDLDGHAPIDWMLMLPWSGCSYGMASRFYYRLTCHGVVWATEWQSFPDFVCHGVVWATEWQPCNWIAIRDAVQKEAKLLLLLISDYDRPMSASTILAQTNFGPNLFWL